jgi:hypothetical protein
LHTEGALKEMDPRWQFWIAYFTALFDAIGPNKAGLSVIQRILFIILPASGVLPVVGFYLAQKGLLAEPFQSALAAWPWVALIVLVWWGITAWVFKDRIASHSWSGDLSARSRFLLPLLLTLLGAAAFAYFSFVAA